MLTIIKLFVFLWFNSSEWRNTQWFIKILTKQKLIFKFTYKFNVIKQ